MRHPTDGRLLAMYFSPERLISLFDASRRDLLLVWHAIPEDARIVDSGYSPERRAFYMIFHHPTFEIVPEGQMIPAANLLIQATDGT